MTESAPSPSRAVSLQGWSEDQLPPALRAAGQILLERVGGRPGRIGDSTVVCNVWVETHTLGCRNAADTAEEDWWEEHARIHDDFASDGISLVVGEPDGIFLTYTPQTNCTWADLGRPEPTPIAERPAARRRR